MAFILTFLLIMSILYMIEEGFNIVKWFLLNKDEKFTQPWYKTLFTFLSLSFIITAIICGI